MPAYRIYFLDREGHLTGPPKVIECADDQQAAGEAAQLVNGKDIEVWDGARVVVKYPHK